MPGGRAQAEPLVTFGEGTAGKQPACDGGTSGALAATSILENCVAVLRSGVRTCPGRPVPGCFRYELAGVETHLQPMATGHRPPGLLPLGAREYLALIQAGDGGGHKCQNS